MAHLTPLPVPSSPVPPSTCENSSPTLYLDPVTAFALAERALAERRRAPRYTVVAEVTFESETNFYSGLTENLSEGGLFIATLAPGRIGATIELELALPDGGPPIAVGAVVRWIRGGEDGDVPAPGMGVQFIDLPAEALDRIRWFTERRDTLLYED